MAALTADAGMQSATQRRLLLSAVFALLLIAAAAAYAPSLPGGYIWTDDFNIANNPDLRGWGGLARIWLSTSSEQYFPLTFTTFWIERQVWGDWPLASRLLNVALHALSGALLWSLLRELRCPGALLAAAVFTMHPLHVESVAWITERRNVLSGVFFLLALRAYLRSERPCDGPGTGGLRRHRRAAWGWFALALLSKSSTVVMPAVALLVRWLETGQWTKRDLARAAPLLLMSAAMAAMTVAYERALNAASLGEQGLTLLQRVGLFGTNAWFYLPQVLWPARLSIVYERPVPPDALVALLPTGEWALLLVALYWGRKWIGRAPLVAAACFLVTLLPVSGLVPFFYLKYSLVADRFAYLPSMSVIAIAAAGIFGLASHAVGRLSLARYVQAGPEIGRRVAAGVPAKEPAGPASVPALQIQERGQGRPLHRSTLKLGLGLVLCAALGARTAQESARFRSDERLWTDAIQKSPQSWIAHAMYARTISDDPPRREEALRHYREALRLRPGEAMAHNNAGMVLIALGRVEEGQAELRAAIECNPRYVDAYLNLAALLVRQNRSGEAVALYRRALAESPDHPLAHLGLGQTLCGRGEDAEGQRHLRRAYEIAPQLRPGGTRGASPARP